jgi:hypothetical protein
MKTLDHAQDRRRAAFSLPEMSVATAVFMLGVAGMLTCHLLGLRMFNITATKLGASQGARAALSKMRDEVRSGKTFYVGHGGSGGFTNTPMNTPRQGNALQVFLTTAPNSEVLYYVDAADKKLKRLPYGSNHPEVVSQYITNKVAFYAEDYAGNVLTNDQNNRVVRMTLDFYQWEFPVASVRAGAFYDYYRLQTRMARRAID